MLKKDLFKHQKARNFYAVEKLSDGKKELMTIEFEDFDKYNLISEKFEDSIFPYVEKIIKI